MKRITTIVLFASIFAVAVGTLGLSGNSAALMVSAVPQTQEGMSMLGHVEYKHLDEFGNIKGYFQNDNVVVEAGKDCAASHLFTDGGARFTNSECIAFSGFFSYVGIGNGTIPTVDGSNPRIGSGNSTLADDTDNVTANCADDGAGTGAGISGGGDMARRNVTATFVTSGTTTVVTLDTSAAGSDGPFTFDVGNATNVIDSGLFNGDYTGGPDGATHTCGGAILGNSDTANVNGGWNMFSRQLLNDDTGITVSDGDSLSVKWTITVG